MSSPLQFSIRIPLCSASIPALRARAAIWSPSKRLLSTRSHLPRSSLRPPERTAARGRTPMFCRSFEPPSSRSKRSWTVSPSSIPTGPKRKAQPDSSSRARRRTGRRNSSARARMVLPAGRFPRTAPSITPFARSRTSSFQGSSVQICSYGQLSSTLPTTSSSANLSAECRDAISSRSAFQMPIPMRA